MKSLPDKTTTAIGVEPRSALDSHPEQHDARHSPAGALKGAAMNRFLHRSNFGIDIAIVSCITIAAHA
ncbi:MAG: hypothetical protein IH605_18555 [Burkholderiales bacterium]|nr:hypothetical protein [Burkholderiales bacterium]